MHESGTFFLRNERKFWRPNYQSRYKEKKLLTEPQSLQGREYHVASQKMCPLESRMVFNAKKASIFDYVFH